MTRNSNLRSLINQLNVTWSRKEGRKEMEKEKVREEEGEEEEEWGKKKEKKKTNFLSVKS